MHEERDKYWAEIDLDDPQLKPSVEQSSVTYHITINGPFPQPSFRPFQLWISVDRYGYVEEVKGYWFGIKLNPHTPEIHDTWMEAAAYLCDMEFVEWRKIGPEDSELFALPKLRVGVGVSVS